MKMARGPILDLSVNHGLGTVNTIAKRAQCSKNNIYLLSPHTNIFPITAGDDAMEIQIIFGTVCSVDTCKGQASKFP